MRGSFISKGSFGSVFRGEVRALNGALLTETLRVAIKMPLNFEVGENPTPELQNAAEAAKRKLRDNPTTTYNEAYRYVRTCEVEFKLKQH